VDCMRAGAVLNGIAVVGEVGDLRSGDVARSGDRPQLEGHGQETGHNAIETGHGTVRVSLDAEGRVPEKGTYDLVVGNPPYYSHYQIAEIFLQAAKRALKAGGRVHIVTKKDEWHLARMPQLFTNVESREVRGYKVVSAVGR